MSSTHDCKQEAGQFIPVINRNRCEGKGDCADVCPVGVFTITTLPKDMRAGLGIVGRIKGIAHGWQQAILVNPDACEACGLCVAACPEDAITLARNPAAPA
jgi:NAD-dependent dihydropyrimidine dehydrogenase PreA subunit